MVYARLGSEPDYCGVWIDNHSWWNWLVVQVSSRRPTRVAEANGSHSPGFGITSRQAQRQSRELTQGCYSTREGSDQPDPGTDRDRRQAERGDMGGDNSPEGSDSSDGENQRSDALRFADAEQRITDTEEELARLQTELTPTKLESNLVREHLKETLLTAANIAHTAIEVLDKLGDSFEESVEEMSRDLNGKDS